MTRARIAPTIALLAAAATVTLPQGPRAQSSAEGPALAPLSAPLAPLARADGSARPVRPRVAAAPPVSDATPPGPVAPGAEATVLADIITVDENRRLEASGGVVVWYQGARLVAQRLIYEGASDRLLIEGPIHLSRPADRGTPDEAVLVADAAELDAELRAGLLRGARLVLARELQLAAREVRVSEGPAGRVTVLENVAASSCRVCAGSPTPLWEIRARRITHDEASRRLIFERPQFRAFGVPLAYAPFTVTAPDPTVERMSGFLRPQVRTTSKLGFGVMLPYFQTLGDSADLTLTPYIAATRTLTLDTRYRQAFAGGALVWEGAVSRDDIRDGTRGYSFATATFALPDRYRLDAQLQWASDRDYLDDYGISDADRLWSGVTLSRVSRERLVILDAGTYRTLRENEDQDLLPTQVLGGIWVQRWTLPAPVGGQALLSWGVNGHRRPSSGDVIGRDVLRASLSADWQRSAILTGGAVVEGRARLDADTWRFSDDPTIDRLASRAVPTVGVTLRWPLQRAGAGGADILEPVVALAWSPGRDDEDEGDIPNEDSLFPEIDEGNIYALDRLPGRDRTETGLRGTVGLTWTRITPLGTSLSLTAARMWHRDDDGLPADSVLGTWNGESRADWLVAASVQRPAGFALSARALLGAGGEVTTGELRTGWLRPDAQVSAGYAYTAPGITGADRLSQARFDAGWQLREGWWARATGRYDLDARQPQRGALGVSYRNECVTVEAEIDRSWSNIGDNDPETGFNLSVSLGGFGRDADRRPGTVARRSCLR